LIKTTTAVLMADFHVDTVLNSAIAKERGTVVRSLAVLQAARSAGTQVVHIVVNFREGYPEISDLNKAFRAIKERGNTPPKDPLSLIVPELAPLREEPVIVKHRVSPFYGTDLDMLLRSRGIDTLVMLGHATSGVILSAVRHGADADYQLIVVEDGCADPDPEVHRFLMERVFPRQASVVSSEEVVAALT
jgi:nicotinamidase-related amidase